MKKTNRFSLALALCLALVLPVLVVAPIQVLAGFYVVDDHEVIDDILPMGPVESNLAHRAVYDLKNEAKQVNTWLTIMNVGGTKEDIKSSFAALDSQTAVYVPTGNSDLYLPDSGDLAYSIYSLRGYSGGIGDVPPVDQSIVLNKEGAGTLTLTGDYSWFNGVINVKQGTLHIQEEGALFGGNINLAPGTKLIWEGGMKDEYNRPHITMTKATLDFELVNQGGGNDIFTFYGQITGDEASKVNFKKGLIYIKGDCSKFVGDVSVYPGAEFVVRKKENVYKGVMFGGKVQVIDAAGEPGTMYIKSNSGLAPLTIDKGTVVIEQDEHDADNPITENTPVDKITVGEAGRVVLMYDDSLLTDTNIHGELELGGGNEATFDNLNIDGGVLRITGDTLGDLRIGGEFNVGSGLISDASTHRNIDLSGATITPIAGRTATFDVQNGSVKLGEIDASAGGNVVMNVVSSQQAAITGDHIFGHGGNNVLFASGVGADIQGTITWDGGKIFAMNDGFDIDSALITNALVLGDGAAYFAGSYDAGGVRTPFVAKPGSVSIPNGTSITTTVLGLQEKTAPKGTVQFEYSTDNGVTWKTLASSDVVRENADATQGTATAALPASFESSSLLRAVYMPSAKDNYVGAAGDFAPSGPIGPSPSTGEPGALPLVVALMLLALFAGGVWTVRKQLR